MIWNNLSSKSSLGGISDLKQELELSLKLWLEGVVEVNVINMAVSHPYLDGRHLP